MQTEINKTHYLCFFFIKIQKEDQKQFFEKRKWQASINFG